MKRLRSLMLLAVLVAGFASLWVPCFLCPWLGCENVCRKDDTRTGAL